MNSIPVGLGNNELAYELRSFPNPVNNILNIQSGSEKTTSLKV